MTPRNDGEGPITETADHQKDHYSTTGVAAPEKGIHPLTQPQHKTQPQQKTHWPNLLDELRLDPRRGNHSPLVLRWHDDQLTPIVEALSPLMPDNLTDEMRYAVAAVARSIVVEEKKSGHRVHYPRAKDPYSQPKRYRDGDPRFTWHYVTKAMDILLGGGLIEHAVGEWRPHTKGYQSVAWATDGLISLIGPLVDVSEPRGIPKQVETIVLRDGADKAEVDYAETADTISMRDQLTFLNAQLAKLELRQEGQHLTIPVVRRIFNESFERGGRLYCQGDSFQNMPAAQRWEITFIVDGTAHPAVEIDYSSLHVRMAYAEARKRIPDGDPYEIDGFDRKLVKKAVNTLFNAADKKTATGAIAEELHKSDPGLREGKCLVLARDLTDAIYRKHRRIRKFFGSDCGARFQRKDSEMAVEIMTRMTQRTGRCALPVHDSFLVPEIDADLLKEVMEEVAKEYGLRPGLKIYRNHEDAADAGPHH